MTKARDADTYRSARRSIAKQQRLDWRALERARESLLRGQVTVRLSPAIYEKASAKP